MTALLEIRNLVKHFGGLEVTRNVNFDLSKGEIKFIIGPNGAGKSTLFRLITGLHQQDSGSIHFNNLLIDDLPSFKRQRLGLAQAFQTPRIVEDLTVKENLFVALNPPRELWRAMLQSAYSEEAEAKVRTALESLGLAGLAGTRARDLSHGNRKKLDIACALVQDHKLLLLDEPTAGVGAQDREQIVAVLHSLKKRSAVLVVAHDMDFIRQVDEEVMLLHLGTILRSGSIAELEKDPLVHDVYFGRHLNGEQNGTI